MHQTTVIDEKYMINHDQQTVRLFSMFYKHVNEHHSFGAHVHPRFYELSFVLEGCKILTVNGKQYKQESGDMTLVYPGDVHDVRVESMSGSSMIMFGMHFYIDDPDFQDLLNRRKQIFYPEDSTVTKRIKPSLDKLISIARRQSSHAERFRIYSAVFDIFAEFHHACREQEKNSRSNNKNESVNGYHIAKFVHELMIDCLAKGDYKLSISDIAKRLGVSLSYCNRVFRRVYNKSPRQYLSEMKLQESIKMLVENKSIEEISVTLGYTDISQFSRQFKRWVGISPSKYKLQCKQDNASMMHKTNRA